jgi:hypothetical protein
MASRRDRCTCRPRRGRAARTGRWNARQGWKQYEPPKQSPTFYFLSNCFGELLGVPITDAGEIARDRVAILMPDKRLYREAGLAWCELFQSTAARPDLGGFFAKIPQHQWADQQLGRVPHPARCYSYKVPPSALSTSTASVVYQHRLNRTWALR